MKVVFSLGEGFELSQEQIEWLEDHDIHGWLLADYCDDKIPRHDVLLVQCIEQTKYNTLGVKEFEEDAPYCIIVENSHVYPYFIEKVYTVNSFIQEHTWIKS